MANIVEFIFESQTVRTTLINGEVYFVAKDVTDILGYKQGYVAVQKHCKVKGVTKHNVLSKGGLQETICINEPNLYRLIAASKLKSAEPFEEWIFDTVLPTIRKTGSYSLQGKSMFPEIYKHIERAELNAKKIPHTYFAMIGEMAVRVLMPLQNKGFDLIADSLPDGSLGKGFMTYLRDNKQDISLIRKYEHEYPDGRKVQANMYPNEFYPYFQRFVHEVWISGKGAAYFKTKFLAK